MAIGSAGGTLRRRKVAGQRGSTGAALGSFACHYHRAPMAFRSIEDVAAYAQEHGRERVIVYTLTETNAASIAWAKGWLAMQERLDRDATDRLQRAATDAAKSAAKAAWLAAGAGVITILVSAAQMLLGRTGG